MKVNNIIMLVMALGLGIMATLLWGPKLEMQVPGLVNFAPLGFGVLRVIVAITMAWIAFTVFDRWGPLKGLDTVAELKAKNPAVGKVAGALILGVLIATALVIR